jgi:hypothetical protein
MNHDLWTPVHVGMPDSDTDVIIATEDGHVEAGFHDGQDWRWLNATIVLLDVTHWMLFPQPPGGRATITG